MTRDRTKYDPDLERPDQLVVTHDGKTLLDDEYIMGSLWEAFVPHVGTIANAAFKVTGGALRFAPGFVRNFLSDRAATAFQKMYDKNSEQAERVLNACNQGLELTREEIAAETATFREEYIRREGTEPLFDVPVDFIVTVQDFVRDVRDRTLPKLPPPAVIDSTSF